MHAVDVTLLDGLTVDQKRKLCRAIADAMVEHAGADHQALYVNLREIARENASSAGVLAADRPVVKARPPVLFGVGHMLLRTRDLDRSLAFYIDVLGLTVRKRGQARDGGALVAMNQGLALTVGGMEGESRIEHLAFRGAAIDALAERVRALGVPIVDGPTVTAEYGMSIYVEDPDANRIEIYGEA